MVETETGGQGKGDKKGECEFHCRKFIEMWEPCLCHSRPHRFLSSEQRCLYGSHHHLQTQPQSIWCVSIDWSIEDSKCIIHSPRPYHTILSSVPHVDNLYCLSSSAIQASKPPKHYASIAEGPISIDELHRHMGHINFKILCNNKDAFAVRCKEQSNKQLWSIQQQHVLNSSASSTHTSETHPSTITRPHTLCPPYAESIQSECSKCTVTSFSRNAQRFLIAAHTYPSQRHARTSRTLPRYPLTTIRTTCALCAVHNICTIPCTQNMHLYCFLEMRNILLNPRCTHTWRTYSASLVQRFLLLGSPTKHAAFPEL